MTRQKQRNAYESKETACGKVLGQERALRTWRSKGKPEWLEDGERCLMMLVSMLVALEALLWVLELPLKLQDTLKRQKALSKRENDIIRFVFLRNPSELLLCVDWIEQNQEWKGDDQLRGRCIGQSMITTWTRVVVVIMESGLEGYETQRGGRLHRIWSWIGCGEMTAFSNTCFLEKLF